MNPPSVPFDFALTPFDSLFVNRIKVSFPQNHDNFGLFVGGMTQPRCEPRYRQVASLGQGSGRGPLVD